jgi:hypothetical protein
LDGTQVTETTLVSVLPELKSLISVWLRGLNVSEETIANLKKQLPKTIFETEPDK